MSEAIDNAFASVKRNPVIVVLLILGALALVYWVNRPTVQPKAIRSQDELPGGGGGTGEEKSSEAASVPLWQALPGIVVGRATGRTSTKQTSLSSTSTPPAGGMVGGTAYYPGAEVRGLTVGGKAYYPGASLKVGGKAYYPGATKPIAPAIPFRIGGY